MRGFESEVASHTGAPYAAAIHSGIAALQAALPAIGMGRGDDAVAPSLALVAAADAVVSVGARPVFIGMLKVAHTMNPADLKARMTPRARPSC